MTKRISLVHYDIGNLLSVERALVQSGADLIIAKTADEILKAEKLLLPGVGAFSSCIEELKKRGLTDVLKEKVKSGTPLLGICVGMQMLFERSHEFGAHEGFGFIPGDVQAIPAADTKNAPHKIPHIGWNGLQHPAGQGEFTHPLLKGVKPGDAVYFVHSFTASPASEADRLADTAYGGQRISAMAGRGNVYGTQFHPEKSGPVGLQILENFVNL